MMSDRQTISEALHKAQEADADLIVALPHWGIEYDTTHSAEQEEYAGWLAEEGADIIIGAHPHVVQDADTIRTAGNKPVPVIYSLGNAISNMSAKNTQVGLMVKLGVTKNSKGETVMLQPEYVFTWCSLPGRLSSSHTTVKIKDNAGRRDEWEQEYEYDKMMTTYHNIKRLTGIED